MELSARLSALQNAMTRILLRQRQIERLEIVRSWARYFTRSCPPIVSADGQENPTRRAQLAPRRPTISRQGVIIDTQSWCSNYLNWYNH
jgi:hypothetical protein